MNARPNRDPEPDGPGEASLVDLFPGTSPRTVQAIRRSLRLLLVLAQSPGPRTLLELGGTMGCSASTVHRLLSTLAKFHLVEKEPVTRRYRLGPTVFHLAAARSKQADVRDLARPHLEALSDASLETVTLEIRRGEHLVTLDMVESIQDLRLVVPLGTATALSELGAKCKSVLAFLPQGEQERILEQVRWERATFTRTTLRQELELIRQQRVARSFGERLPVAASVAVPLFDSRGDVVASISVAGPTGRWTAESMDRLDPLLRSAAETISHDLGYRWAAASTVNVSGINDV